MNDARQTVMEAEAVAIRYGATPVVSDVNLTIMDGAQLVMTGRSGSGKTSLLLAFACLIAPSSGRVSWPGLDVRPKVRRAQIGMVFQAPSLMPELSALQNVMLPLRMAGSGEQSAVEAAGAALCDLGVEDLSDALPTQLSGGQQQRIAVARVLAGRHRLVLADEPTGALDRDSAHHVVQCLRRGVAAAGGALVLATHDQELADTFEDTMSVEAGRLAAGALR